MLSTGEREGEREREITFKDELLIASKLGKTVIPFRFVPQKNPQAEFEVIYVYLEGSFAVLKSLFTCCFLGKWKDSFLAWNSTHKGEIGDIDWSDSRKKKPMELSNLAPASAPFILLDLRKRNRRAKQQNQTNTLLDTAFS